MAKLHMLKPRIAIDDTVPRIRGRAWMTIRARIMRRDCGLCQECKRHGRIKPGTQVDHIIALTNDGTNDDDNLETICVECHARKSLADMGFKERVTIGVDGWPVDPEAVNIRPVWRMSGYV